MFLNYLRKEILELSFVVEYRHGKLQKCIQYEKRIVPSPLNYLKTMKMFISGEIFGISLEEFALLNWKEKPDILNEVEGNIAVLSVAEDSCTFAIDMNGLDGFYYYHKNGRFIVSDKFWDIVKEIQPSIEEINTEAVRFMLFEGGTINGESIIENLRQIMPNHIITYSAVNDKLNVRQYRRISYSCTCDDEEEAVAHMDRILKNTMKNIKAQCGEVTYGLGISGGLDSRIISHYAKEAGMNITGFNICVPKPHGWLEAMSVKSARRIAETFHVGFSVVSWKHENLREKIRFAVKQSPDFSGNSFKYETVNMPEFDVLLTGGSGLIVGSMLPNNLDAFTEEQLLEAIYDLFSSYGSVNFIGRCKRALKYLFGVTTKKKTEKNLWWAEVLVGNNYKDVIYHDYKDFIHCRLKQGLSKLEIFEDYFLNICGHNNRYGAFETLFSTKRAFSIYVPFLLKETLTWTPRLLYNRKVLKKLIEEKIPEVADIETESFISAPNKNGETVVSKLLTMIKFLLRGNGTSIDEHFMKKTELITQFINYINANQHDWFHKLFNIEDIKINKKIVANEPIRITVRVWELKALIDCLENKDYLQY